MRKLRRFANLNKLEVVRGSVQHLMEKTVVILQGERYPVTKLPTLLAAKVFLVSTLNIP